MSPIKDNSNDAVYWRTLAELEKLPESDGVAPNSLPDSSDSQIEGINRRQFARLMAASMALAGATVSGCRRWPEQQVRPQVTTTEGFLPGVAEYFATIFELGGVATGILAKSLDGRPIKIEGNPAHPFSLGAAGVFAQASVLELYDPERSREYIFRQSNGVAGSSDRPRQSAPALRQSRQEFEKLMSVHFADFKKRQGAGLHFLSSSVSSPTYARLVNLIQTTLPKSSWHRYDPLDRDNELSGTKLAFGQAVRCQYHLDRASTIVCLNADILGNHPGHQRWCREWARGRQPDSKSFNRLIAIESGYSITGAAADVRIPLRPSQIAKLIAYLASCLGLVSAAISIDETTKKLADGVIHELQQAGTGGLVVAGPALSPEIQSLVHAINDRLGSIGNTITFSEEPFGAEKKSIDSLAELCGALRGGTVDTLVILEGNPVYDAPSDLPLALTSPRPGKQLVSVYLGLFDNETSQRCTWHVPASHYLESWGDGRAWDGTYSIQQPLIQPLFDGMSAIELMSLVSGQTVQNGLDLVRQTARANFRVESEAGWQTLLHDGVLPDSCFSTVSVRQPAVQAYTQIDEKPGLEVCFVPDSKAYDGRFANNGWLQELPDPITKLTWGNAALISKADADLLGIVDGDEIELEFESDHKLGGIPALIQPGQAPGCVSISMGYGRLSGHIASNIGVDVCSIRTGTSRFVVGGAKVVKTGRWQKLAVTQEHHLIDSVGAAGRDYRIGSRHQPGALVRETTLAQHLHDPHEVHQPFHVPQPAPMFDPPHTYDSPHAWGMAIDLNACIGCSACVVACQAENNIPIVGKENVIRNREMHWIRIDRYFKGDVSSPDIVHVPVACVQCKDAPCEQVCPVAATVHDSEGLNSMVYNRCVGTRYCSNNCPYKVRRFNYFDYHASDPRAPARPWLNVPDQQTMGETSKVKQLVFNPEVTVRMRGVMEKCTYCVQRLVNAKHNAKLEMANGDRDSPILRDGEVMTACQQTCPTNAISFGDLNDKNSRVANSQNDARAYAMLGELNIKPRTHYLSKIRNVDPPASEAAVHD